MTRVAVTYVDQEGTWDADASDWPLLRADGVDEVVIYNASGASHIAGCTLYWVYPEGDVWVRGGAGLGMGYADKGEYLPPETLCLPDGTQTHRTVEWVPDLPHDAVKLGWWYPGTKGRVV